MNLLSKIIKEEYIKIQKFLNEEYDEDRIFDLTEKRDEYMNKIFDEFLFENNSDFSKKIQWKLIPFLRLKKIWEDYMKLGTIRDIKGLDFIESIIIQNILKVSIITELWGHTSKSNDDIYEDNIGYYVDYQLKCLLPQQSNSPCNTTIHPFIKQSFEENYNKDMSVKEIKEKIVEILTDKFHDFTTDPKSGHGYMSDYGLKPLETLVIRLYDTDEPKDKLVLIDKVLNVVHQRSDIAAWFIEGGQSSLNQLSGYDDAEEGNAISGKYRMSDYD